MVIKISSDFASIADSNTGGNVCYRLSKCAIGQLSKTTAMDLQCLVANVVALAVHPGYVPTKMTGLYGEDDMEEHMTGLVDVVERFGQKGEETALANGTYVRWNGQKMQYGGKAITRLVFLAFRIISRLSTWSFSPGSTL